MKKLLVLILLLILTTSDSSKIQSTNSKSNLRQQLDKQTFNQTSQMNDTSITQSKVTKENKMSRKQVFILLSQYQTFKCMTSKQQPFGLILNQLPFAPTFILSFYIITICIQSVQITYSYYPLVLVILYAFLIVLPMIGFTIKIMKLNSKKRVSSFNTKIIYIYLGLLVVSIGNTNLFLSIVYISFAITPLLHFLSCCQNKIQYKCAKYILFILILNYNIIDTQQQNNILGIISYQYKSLFYFFLVIFENVMKKICPNWLQPSLKFELTIKQYLQERNEEQLSCPICFMNFETDEPMFDIAFIEAETVTIVMTKCKHIYHSICLKEWLKVRYTCPMDSSFILI